MITSSVPVVLKPVKEIGRITITLSESADGMNSEMSIKKDGDISQIARVAVFYPNPGYTGPGGVQVPPSESLWCEFSDEILRKLNEQKPS